MTPRSKILPFPFNVPPEKFCPRCNQIKFSSEFYVSRGRHDGITVYCKKCESDRAKLKLKIKYTPEDLTAYFICITCGVSKIATDFPLSASKKSGLKGDCRLCNTAKIKRRRHANPEKYRQRKLRYVTKNAEKVAIQKAKYNESTFEKRKEYRKIRNIENPNYEREKWLRKSHNTTKEWYKATLASQHGVCGVCGTNKSRNSGSNTFAIDHDHSCCPPGKSCEKCRRGLLCFRCNTWIERLENIPGIAKRAMAYLKKYKSIAEPNRDHPIDLFSH